MAMAQLKRSTPGLRGGEDNPSNVGHHEAGRWHKRALPDKRTANDVPRKRVERDVRDQGHSIMSVEITRRSEWPFRYRELISLNQRRAYTLHQAR
jgi:hypothetical protein